LRPATKSYDNIKFLCLSNNDLLSPDLEVSKWGLPAFSISDVKFATLPARNASEAVKSPTCNKKNEGSDVLKHIGGKGAAINEDVSDTPLGGGVCYK
jgi:hypothetical protein